MRHVVSVEGAGDDVLGGVVEERRSGVVLDRARRPGRLEHLVRRTAQQDAGRPAGGGGQRPDHLRVEAELGGPRRGVDDAVEGHELVDEDRSHVCLQVAVVVVRDHHPRSGHREPSRSSSAPERRRRKRWSPDAVRLLIPSFARYQFGENRDTAAIMVSPLSHREPSSRGGRPTGSPDEIGPGGLMTNTQLMDAPAAATRPTTDAAGPRDTPPRAPSRPRVLRGQPPRSRGAGARGAAAPPARRAGAGAQRPAPAESPAADPHRGVRRRRGIRLGSLGGSSADLGDADGRPGAAGGGRRGDGTQHVTRVGPGAVLGGRYHLDRTDRLRRHGRRLGGARTTSCSDGSRSR